LADERKPKWAKGDVVADLYPDAAIVEFFNNVD
jgi:hypothetical protein